MLRQDVEREGGWMDEKRVEVDAVYVWPAGGGGCGGGGGEAVDISQG